MPTLALQQAGDLLVNPIVYLLLQSGRVVQAANVVGVEVVDVAVGVGGQLALHALVPLLLPLHAAAVGRLWEAKLIISVRPGLARTLATTCRRGK